MTLPGILYLVYGKNKDKKKLDDTTLVKIVLKCCPYLQYAKQYASRYYYDGDETQDIEKKRIRKYVLEYHQYDAIDIGRLVKLCVKAVI
jgi:hypothetical protein